MDPVYAGFQEQGVQCAYDTLLDNGSSAQACVFAVVVQLHRPLLGDGDGTGIIVGECAGCGWLPTQIALPMQTGYTGSGLGAELLTQGGHGGLFCFGYMGQDLVIEIANGQWYHFLSGIVYHECAKSTMGK